MMKQGERERKRERERVLREGGCGRWAAEAEGGYSYNSNRATAKQTTKFTRQRCRRRSCSAAGAVAAVVLLLLLLLLLLLPSQYVDADEKDQ